MTSPSGLNDLPFDVNAFMVIKYSNQMELEDRLYTEINPFLEKVRVMGLYQQALVKSVREILKRLKDENQEYISFLRRLLIMGKEDFKIQFIETYFRTIYQGTTNPVLASGLITSQYLSALEKFGLVENKREKLNDHRTSHYFLNLSLLPILRQEAFKEIE
ncbi:MAG: hypothetical protein NTW14_13050 [bacterium]|nr:hypothetical protein [bacterium]